MCVCVCSISIKVCVCEGLLTVCVWRVCGISITVCGELLTPVCFLQKSWAACTRTGYVERINCTKSNRDEYKR